MPDPAAAPPPPGVPLCVDLDGTLITTDLLWESLVGLLKRSPLATCQVPCWWLRGRAHLKARLAERVSVDPAGLPYHQPLLDYLRGRRREGTPLLLVTASAAAPARRVADHVGLFDEVLASDGKTNLRGPAKAAKLVDRFGARGFDYAGNSSVDLPVWAQSREAIVVNCGPGLAARARQRATVSRYFPAAASPCLSLLHALRPQRWIKNLIVFVPLLASHNPANIPLLLNDLRAFCAFCLCASAGYILNDLFDLEADRRHPATRGRPFAAGALPLWAGLLAAPLLLAAGLAIGATLPSRFPAVLGAYLLLTAGYSWRAKPVPGLDVLCLAALYALRLLGGYAATGLGLSAWVLTPSILAFLGLAFAARRAKPR
jgi:hypothetical protein